MITIEVCVGSACHLNGSYDIINKFQDLIKSNELIGRVEVRAVFCMGNCTRPVSVRIHGGEVFSANLENIEGFFNDNVISRL